MSRKDTHHVPHPKILEKAEEAFLKEGHAIERALVEKPRSAIQRFPLIFTLLVAFGLVATFDGFEGVMDRMGLSQNPYLLLAIGIIILTFTGNLYKRLEG